MISLAAENKNSSMHAAWLVLSRCRWEPGDDGVGTDGLDGGRVTLDHHGPRQPEFLELPEEELPLLGLLSEGRDVQLLLQVPREGQA